MHKLLLDPRQLKSTHYFTDQIIGLNVAASHNVVDGEPASYWGWAAGGAVGAISNVNW
jgi:cephalosporin-C deacetylase-like acetyl esterase